MKLSSCSCSFNKADWCTCCSHDLQITVKRTAAQLVTWQLQLGLQLGCHCRLAQDTADRRVLPVPKCQCSIDFMHLIIALPYAGGKASCDVCTQDMSDLTTVCYLQLQLPRHLTKINLLSRFEHSLPACIHDGTILPACACVMNVLPHMAFDKIS